MKTSLHLLSMPMHDPVHPSSQLGYLHAYVRDVFGDVVPVRSYSAYMDILLGMEDDGLGEFYSRYRLFGEEIFFLVCCCRMPRHPGMFERVLDLYNQSHPPDLRVSRQTILALAEAMEAYLEDDFIPHLDREGLHVVGMTTTFAQVFASIFAAGYIGKHARGQLLFVFGGASMALHEATRTLDLWGVRGLMVAGSGEAPLRAILEACLDLRPDQMADVEAAIDSADLVNVTRVGSARKPIDLAMSREFLETIPDPDYDEFFSRLRSVCDDAVYAKVVEESVALPLEGSRGCFARCDFCQNPDITSRFRTLKGRKVAERALVLCNRYQIRRVFFADSVCNSWAEEYADHLLAGDARIAAFMEMRVHAPETFWTKLALAGVSEMQLGIEAASEPLLSAMSKGTTVMQNLAAAKYLAELRVNSLSNLITHHPKSTVSDVERTTEITKLIEHFPQFCLSRFVISYASPIHKQLNETQKSQLVRGFDWLPSDLCDYSFPRDLAYAYPEDWLAPEVADAWDRFRQWYDAHVNELAVRRPAFTVERKGDEELLVTDTRFGASLEYSLRGAPARVFTFCHNVTKAAQIEQRCRLKADVVRSILAEFVERSMVVKVGDRYLSLALRPRQELVENLLRKKRSEETGDRSALPPLAAIPGDSAFRILDVPAAMA